MFSGYIVNYGISLALPPGNLTCSDLSGYIPFKLSPNRFRYLGMNVCCNIDDMVKMN